MAVGIQQLPPQINLTAREGRHVFRRGATLHLDQVLRELPVGTRYLHIYCVDMEFGVAPVEGVVSIQIPLDSGLRHIHIFTCNFLTQTSPRVSGFRFVTSSRLKVDLYYECVPAGLAWIGSNRVSRVIARDYAAFDFDSMGSESTKDLFKKEIETNPNVASRLSPNRGIAGISLAFSPGTANLEPISQIPGGEFDTPAPLGGALSIYDRDSSGMDNLAFLLNYLFSQACFLVFDALAAFEVSERDADESKARSYLSFICRCTQRSALYASLREDAATLLLRLDLARRYPAPQCRDPVMGRYMVPHDSPSNYKGSLDAALARCNDVQKSVNDFKWETRMTQEMRETNAKSLEALAVLGLGTIPNDKNYDDMMTSARDVVTKKKDLEDRKGNLIGAKNNFEKGLVEYEKQKKKERDMAIMTGIFQIGFKLVVGLCTNPAAVVPSLVDITTAVTEAVSKGDGTEGSASGSGAKTPDSPSKAKHIVEKNNEVLRGQAEQVRRQEAQERMQEASVTASAALSEASPPFDYFGLMADWAEIKNSVTEMFAVLKFKLGSDTIQGLEEYSTALCNMIARGQTLLEVQRKFQDQISAYFRGVAENELRLKRVEQIKAAARDLRSNPNGELPHLADRIRELNASIVVMKRTVVLHLHRYLLSLKYRSSQFNSIRVRASPEMGVEKLRDVLAKVEARVVNDFDQSGNEQTAPELEFSTDDQTTQNVFPADWKAWLRQLRDIPFSVPYDHKEAMQFHDVRIQDISAAFFNKDDAPFHKVSYSITLGPVFLDRDDKGDLRQYYAREFLLKKRDNDGQWMTARQADGDQAKILPALFSSGSIGLTDTDQKKGGLVLEEVEKVVLRVGIRGLPISRRM